MLLLELTLSLNKLCLFLKSLEKENEELRKEIKNLKLKCEDEEGQLDSLKKDNMV